MLPNPPRGGNRGDCSNWTVEGSCKKKTFDGLCAYCQSEVKRGRYGRIFEVRYGPKTPPTPQHLLDWEELADRHEVFLRLSGGREPRPPEPLTVEEVARFIAALLHPKTRGMLADALALVLAEPIAEIVAATREAG